MDPQRLEEIVRQCLAAPLKGREQVLQRECGGDGALADAVRSALLRSLGPEALRVSSMAMDDMGVTTTFETGSYSPTPPAEESRTSQRETSTLAVGDVLDSRYRIDAFLAAGGMGQVYRVHDLELDVSLALKTIRPEIASRPAALRHFKQEVLLARSVTHTHVCRIFDLGRDVGRDVSFLTMEFLPGDTLSSRIETAGALKPEEALPLVRQMSAALDTAHRAGVIHRDFKSPNVMLVPDGDGSRAVITDFGLAMIAEGDTAKKVVMETSAPRPKAIVGTPAYMSPEQVQGGQIGPASDLYALGVVLFEMCTGQLPFREATALETAQAHLTKEPPSPRALADVDESWERTVLCLLSKHPENRYSTAREVVLALEGRLDGGSANRHSLPAERDAFVGRTVELKAIATHLEGSSDTVATRLLTLQSTGGAGKTRLAQKYGWESLRLWPGGIWFCNLSEARSIDGIVQAAAKGLHVPLGGDDPIAQLGNAIAGRGKSLVILDNFEQVVEHADATLGHWHGRATQASFLVTSRGRLDLPEEVTYALEPLDPMTQGVELFEVRGQGHHPGFGVDETNRQQVEEIVQKLDGLPLAIELAAARLRMLSLPQLAERLADRFRVLAGGKRGRHSTLAATLDWSWNLLEPWEQSAIAQVSVFEHGFTLEAAEVVIDLEGHPETPFVLDVIQALIDKSWLRTGSTLVGTRFAMYATVQEYASAKLRAIPGAAAGSSKSLALSRAESRHRAYFAEMGTEEAIESLDRHGGVELRAALGDELENLVAACRRAIAAQEENVAAATYVAVHEVLSYCGPLAISFGLGNDALATLKNVVPRARVLLFLGMAEMLAGRTNEARTHTEAALTLFRETGDRRREGFVLRNLAKLHRRQGRMEEANDHYEAALAICREEGDRRCEGIVLNDLGIFQRDQGRMEEARSYYEAALSIHREEGNRCEEGFVLGNLGVLFWAQGRMEEARAHYDAGLAIHREVGDQVTEGIALGNLGILHEAEGRVEDALSHYEAALMINREVGDRSSEGYVLGNLGILYEKQGRIEAALAHYESALAIHREVGDRRTEANVLGNLGSFHKSQGWVEEARSHLEAALVIHRELGDRKSEGAVLERLHRVLAWDEPGDVEPRK